MKLLFDENLSHHLIESLASLFPGSTHVRKIGLERADDRAIWAYAIANGGTSSGTTNRRLSRRPFPRSPEPSCPVAVR